MQKGMGAQSEPHLQQLRIHFFSPNQLLQSQAGPYISLPGISWICGTAPPHLILLLVLLLSPGSQHVQVVLLKVPPLTHSLHFRSQGEDTCPPHPRAAAPTVWQHPEPVTPASQKPYILSSRNCLAQGWNPGRLPNTF